MTASAVHNELVKAFEASDELTVRRLGWYPVYEVTGADGWWSPRQQCTMADFTPYAKALGNEPPDVVLEAFRSLAGEWRPSVGAVIGEIRRRREATGTVNVGRARDRAKTPAALAAVARALDTGETPCDCGFHQPVWRINGEGVLRCRTCNGLEPGQTYDAEDAGAVAA